MAKAPSALGEARLAKEQALAKLLQLQSPAALEGRLLERDAVRAQWAQAFTSLRDRALAMGDRISSRRTEDELRAIVDAEMRDLLAVWSRGDL
jgi:hypothetical protein